MANVITISIHYSILFKNQMKITVSIVSNVITIFIILGWNYFWHHLNKFSQRPCSRERIIVLCLLQV